jgi:hypothetical protein
LFAAGVLVLGAWAGDVPHGPEHPDAAEDVCLAQPHPNGLAKSNAK